MRRINFGLILDLVLLCITALIAGWAGWSHVTAIDDAEMLRETRDLPIPILAGAIHLALGRGIGATHDREAGFPELEAFMNLEINEIPRDAYPHDVIWSPADNHYFYMHYHMILYLGSIFRLFGISVWSFRLACVLLHAASMLALYGIFRLAMGRLSAFLFAGFVAGSGAYLTMLPSMRDFSKVPFMLAAVLIMGVLIKQSRRPARLCLEAALLGGVIGVGYGFRQDLFVCLPLALFSIMAGAGVTGNHPWRSRMAACLMVLLAFGASAYPVLKADREVGSTITVHTLFQGLTASAEKNANFGSSSYDFGYLYFDHPIIAQIRGYAKRTDDIYPVRDLTPEYGEVGKRMFRDTVMTVPADFAARMVAVMDSIFGIHATPLIFERQKPATTADMYPWKYEHAVGEFFGRYGMAIAMAALLLVAAARYKTAFFLALFVGYFCAYPSTLFEYRHYFYLAFMPYFLAGIFAATTFQGARALLRQARGGTLRHEAARQLRACTRGFLFVAVVTVCTVATLLGLRVFQRAQWDRLLYAYEQADLVQVPLNEERQGSVIRLSPRKNIFELIGVAPPSGDEVAAAYLAARFQGGERTLSFQLLNNNPVFARPCTIALQDSGVYFFPVYEYEFDVPFTFLGIELDAADRPHFEGLYLFTSAEEMRLWPHVFVPQERDTFVDHKSGAFERNLRAVSLEIRALWGGSPVDAIAGYEALIRRHPFHHSYAARVLSHARRSRDADLVLRAWKSIGTFMPELRGRAGQEIAVMAEAARDRNDGARAIFLYRAALQIQPEEMYYREQIGALLENLGDRDGARREYQDIVLKQPRNFGLAHHLHTLHLEDGLHKEAIAFWDQLVRSHPDAALPRLFHGLALTHAGDTEAAIQTYAEGLQVEPGHRELLLQLGELHLRDKDLEAGLRVLRQLTDLHADSSDQVFSILVEQGLGAREREEYHGAAMLLEASLELQPDNHDIWLALGEVYLLEERTQEAQLILETLLNQDPGNAAAARILDQLYTRWRRDMPAAAEARALFFWQSLVTAHPETVLPKLYLGVTFEWTGMATRARTAYLQALDRHPGYGGALYRLGALDILDGQTEEGLDRLRAAALADPALSSEISSRCVELARDAGEKGLYALAVSLCEVALEISPADLWPKVYLGELKEQLGELEEAIAVYTAILMAAPESPLTAHRLDALLQRTLTDPKARAAAWLEISKHHPGSAISAFYLGMSLEALGDREGAHEAYETAVRNNPELPGILDRIQALELGMNPDK